MVYLDTGTLIREAYREPHGHLAGASPIRPVVPPRSMNHAAIKEIAMPRTLIVSIQQGE